MNTIQSTETIGTIADKDYRKADVFKPMGIDFLYNGDKTLNEGGKETGITAEKLMTALEQITIGKTISSREFDNWDLDSLINYILDTHHRYTKENAVIIYDLAQKIVYHHGENQSELINLTTAMFLFFHDLLNCMRKEEEILFPSIKQLAKDKSKPGNYRYTTFGLIKDWVTLIHKEHQASIKDLKLIHELTNNYMLRDDTCNSYKYLFDKMKKFETDLLMHLHLENNILFPKAIVEDEESNDNDNAVINTKFKK